MSSHIVFAETVDGVWVDGPEGGELCLYTEQNKDGSPRGVVVGLYKKKNHTPIKLAVMFKPDGGIVLQEEENGQFVFTKLNADLVSCKLVEFLYSLAGCAERSVY